MDLNMGEEYRVGLGYDLHPLVPGRKLVLGGVEIDHELGLEGHSDADVLIHAVCDAVLGALGEGDIGEHFPETEDNRGISSMKILSRVVEVMENRGYGVVNVDCVVLAERPKLSIYRERFAENMAGVLGVDSSRISVKATRGEGLGPIGEERAIAAHAVVLLKRKE